MKPLPDLPWRNSAFVGGQVRQAPLKPVGAIVEAEFPVAADRGLVAPLRRLMALGSSIEVGEFGSKPCGEQARGVLFEAPEASHGGGELGPGFDGFVPGEGEFRKPFPESGGVNDVVRLPPCAHPMAFGGIETSGVEGELPEEFVGPAPLPPGKKLGGRFEVPLGERFVVPGEGDFGGPILRLGAGLWSIPEAIDGPFGITLGFGKVFGGAEPGELQEREAPADPIAEGGKKRSRFPKALQGSLRVGFP